MDSNRTEACGRCSMTSVVDLAGGEGERRDPFGGERIEVSESEMRIAAAPAVVAGRLKRKIDGFVANLIYGG